MMRVRGGVLIITTRNLVPTKRVTCHRWILESRVIEVTGVCRRVIDCLTSVAARRATHNCAHHLYTHAPMYLSRAHVDNEGSCETGFKILVIAESHFTIGSWFPYSPHGFQSGPDAHVSPAHLKNASASSFAIFALGGYR